MDKNLNRLVGKNLLKYRKSRGLTQEAVAEKANISTSFYANLERGNKSMSLEVLCSLSSVLCVSIDNLLDDGMRSGKTNNIALILQDKTPAEIEAIEEIIMAVIKQFDIMQGKEH
ncbi:MAG: helix-turn-helix transcriptional regulator [Firmicutes bacterium]|nr:helix-turn-helix transcriptional regulator [Bacillota bacterium]